MPSSAGIAEPQPVPQAPSDLPGPSAQDLPAQPGSFHITARYGAATEELTLPQQDPSECTRQTYDVEQALPSRCFFTLSPCAPLQVCLQWLTASARSSALTGRPSS